MTLLWRPAAVALGLAALTGCGDGSPVLHGLADRVEEVRELAEAGEFRASNEALDDLVVRVDALVRDGELDRARGDRIKLAAVDVERHLFLLALDREEPAPTRDGDRDHDDQDDEDKGDDGDGRDEDDRKDESEKDEGKDGEGDD